MSAADPVTGTGVAASSPLPEGLTLIPSSPGAAADASVKPSPAANGASESEMSEEVKGYVRFSRSRG